MTIRIKVCSLWGLLLVLGAACSPPAAQKLPLSTSSDSVVYYYYDGWEQVLDYGHFGNSEKAYRRMYELDPEFLVGASLLARITPDPAERFSLLQTIESKASQIEGDERDLLSLFINLTRLYVYRETNQNELIADHRQMTMREGEEILGRLFEKYPDDFYYGCEYIEFVHANRGAEIALQKLNEVFPQPPPFMVGYKGQLLAELDRFEEASAQVVALEQMMQGTKTPYIHMVYAKIYQEKGEPMQALDQVEKALRIDPTHVLALRMRDQLSND